MKDKKLCHRILSFIDKTPWAIRPDALEKIISIANRSYSDPQLVSAIKSEQSLSVINADDTANIAVIDVIGPIFTRADFFSEISGAASIDALERRLDDALYDDSIKAIILRIDSPGGEVTGTHEFANYIDEACEIKPIVAYVQGMACSAAYWIASATSHIYADKTATAGSIGVVATWTDDSKARTAAGLTDYEVVSSQSPNKRLDPTQDSGRAELQKQIDGLADIFIDDVANFRNVSRDKVLSDFGQGGTFLAESAITIGMLDEISSLRDVISELSTEENTNNININGARNMGVKSKLNKQNFTLKAKGRSAEDDENLDKKGAGDLEDDRDGAEKDDQDLDDLEKTPGNSVEDDDDNLAVDEDPEKKPENSGEDDEDNLAEDYDDLDKKRDDEETPAAKKAINAFARKKPNLYRAILKRGALHERNRIASIDKLNIVGHQNLIHRAKYEQPLSAAQTSYAVLRAEQKQRSNLAKDYAEDGSYRIPTSTSNQSNQSSSSANQTSFLKNVIAGAKAAMGVK